MWNSWVDREVIESIRKNLDKHREWFYIKLLKGRDDRDRMENEELYTSLAYLEFQRMKNKDKDAEKYLYIYNRNDGINVRMGSSQEITRVLQSVSEENDSRANFLKAIKSLESFLKKVKLVLLDRNVEGDKNVVDEFFSNELNSLFKAERQVRSFRRTKQDFYILWYLLNSLNFGMVKFCRLEIKKDLQRIFNDLRSNTESFTKEAFLSQAQTFHEKYSVDSRRVKLSDVEKAEMLAEQGNLCAISGAPLFIGDEIEVDHNVPLGIGGADSVDNLQITHKLDNREKGARPLLVMTRLRDVD